MTHNKILKAILFGLTCFFTAPVFAKLVTVSCAVVTDKEGHISTEYASDINELLARGTVQTTYNLIIYSLTFPDVVCVGQQFPITVQLQNPTGTNVAAVVPFADITPDPTQGAGFTPGLLFISNTAPTQGTFDATAATLQGLGGRGAWFNLGIINANTTLTVTQTIQATATGIQTYTAAAQGNPVQPLPPVIINVVSAPTAVNQTFATCFNTPVSGSVGATGGSGSYIFAVVGGSEVGGTVTSFNAATGAFTFTPTAGFSGVGGFNFTVTDAQSGCTGSAQGVITITVDSSIITTGATLSTCVSTPLNGTLVGNVSGGTPPYTFSQVGVGVNGVAVVNPGGTFTFTPTAGFAGAGSFQFQVTDNLGCVSNISTVTVNIGPLAAPQTLTTCSNTPLNGNVTGLVTGGVAPLTFSQVGVAVNGVAVVNANGTFTFTPTPNFVGVGSFQYRVTDANQCTSTATIIITIEQCCIPSDVPFIQYYDLIYPVGPI